MKQHYLCVEDLLLDQHLASNTVGRGARRAADAVESVPVLGAVVRTIDSAHQQHGLNQRANGSRADNYNVDTGRTDSYRMNDQRASLDHDGTLQYTIALLLYALIKSCHVDDQ